MTVFILKILAMIAMTADHMGYAFFGDNVVMRIVGRLAFLFYAFMIAEGFNHFKNKPDRVKHHVIKLAVLCVVSEFAYDFFETGKPVDWGAQSVMPVLLLGLVGLIITEKFINKPWIYILFYIGAAYATYLAKTSYSFVGVLLIYAFYFYIKHAGNRSFPERLIFLFAMISVYFTMYIWAKSGYGGLSAWLASFKEFAPLMTGHAAAAVCLALYDGKPGYGNKVFGWFYSLYFPLHLVVLGIIRFFVGR